MSLFHKIDTSFFILVVILFLSLPGCDQFSQYNAYDRGYDAAWDEEELPFYASQQEKTGYEEGLDDAWMYDEGYYDGMNDKKPKYCDDQFYMDGYKDGKKWK
jgi:hypothetical protein